MSDPAVSRRAWVIGGLTLYSVAIAAVLLLPASYSGIVNAIGDWLRYAVGIDWFGSGWIEFGANILMLVPLGFLLTLLFRRAWVGVLLAFVMSAAAELAQFVIPSRQPTVRDILANTAGAALGAALAWLTLLRRARRSSPPGSTDEPQTGTTRAR